MFKIFFLSNRMIYLNVNIAFLRFVNSTVRINMLAATTKQPHRHVQPFHFESEQEGIQIPVSPFGLRRCAASLLDDDIIDHEVERFMSIQKKDSINATMQKGFLKRSRFENNIVHQWRVKPYIMG